MRCIHETASPFHVPSHTAHDVQRRNLRSRLLGTSIKFVCLQLLVHYVIFQGFARYSTDERWHVPHFEKMLYDQAQLASVYTDAYAIKQDADLARVVRDILTYTSTYLSDPSGGFYRFQTGLTLRYFNQLNSFKKCGQFAQCRRCRFFPWTRIIKETGGCLLRVDSSRDTVPFIWIAFSGRSSGVRNCLPPLWHPTTRQRGSLPGFIFPSLSLNMLCYIPFKQVA